MTHRRLIFEEFAQASEDDLSDVDDVVGNETFEADIPEEFDEDEALSEEDEMIADDVAEEDAEEGDVADQRGYSSVVRVQSELTLPSRMSTYREVGKEATWIMSTAKAVNGAEALRCEDVSMYWQSDGMHPHSVTVQFHKRAALMEMAMFLNVKADESYTPRKIRVLAGMTIHNLELVVDVETEEPLGWIMIPLADPKTGRPLRAHTVHIQCLSMHQNGRDTRVRSMRFFGPRATLDETTATAAPLLVSGSVLSRGIEFRSVNSGAMGAFATVR